MLLPRRSPSSSQDEDQSTTLRRATVLHAFCRRCTRLRRSATAINANGRTRHQRGDDDAIVRRDCLFMVETHGEVVRFRSGGAGFSAAGCWFLSASGQLPAMITYWDQTARQ